MPPTPLTRQIAARIVDHIREERAPEGTRLVERALAEHLRVSRSPVRRALRLLEDAGVVAPTERGGYTVLRAGDQLAAPDGDDDTDSEPYLRIAADRLDGVLPDRVTENALGRRYDVESDQPIVTAVQRVAEARGIPMAQVALAWVLRNPVVTAPIVGPTKSHHLIDAVAALEVELSDDEVQALEEHYRPHVPTAF